MTKILLFLAILLALGLGVCTIPWPNPSLVPSAAAQLAPRPTPAVCPEGLCAIGWSNSVPPRPICGECRTSTPHRPATSCPKPLALGAYVYLNDKPYGQGFDSTPRVHGDPEFCRLIHGVAINDCHLEGWPKRNQCEMELLQGCPVRQFTVDAGTTVVPCVDDHAARCSCDHFGSVEYRDDPQTPTTGDTLPTLRGFEGRPLECGLQRDAHGPVAGFFTVAHGIGQVRACKPDGAGCGPWRPFDH
ncbi:MAG TPA: hypothetical protein VLF95_13285 [Vicinamibacteria bacterium]|nr:hypothetical protein [Vicinamibacteria bacterium]